MRYSLRNTLFYVLLLALCSFTNRPQQQHTNIIVFKGIRDRYVPFSYINSSAIEVRNNILNIVAIDKNGDMLQIKGVPISKVQNGILTPSEFRTIYISEKNGTHHDDADTNPYSLLEIKCNDNKPGTPISIGLKTTLMMNGKAIRVYATLSGIIPSYIYTEQN